MSVQKNFVKHQFAVQRKNLTQVCRFSVKCLIDRSCFDTIGEHSTEITNFCNIMEHVLSHRLKSRSSWYSKEDRNFWDYIRIAVAKVPHNCIGSIQSMEQIATPRGKGRAWLKMALMEKRLAEYIGVALKENKLTKSYYGEGALMLSEEAHTLTGSLLGLNAIDFSFDLKGESNDLDGFPVIDYTPFLKFQQCPESISSDTKELQELSNSTSTSSILSEEAMLDSDDEDSYKRRYLKMEAKYKAMCEQKGYLEELVRLREHKLGDVEAQRQKLVETIHNLETESRKERQELESVIIELQSQLVSVKRDQQKFEKHVREFFSPTPVIQEPSLEAIGYQERSPLKILGQTDSDVLSFSSGDVSASHLLPDNRSVLSDQSGISGLRDETQSMIPLAGSFTSLTSNRSSETQKSNEVTAKFKIDFIKDVPMATTVDARLLSPVAMAVLESNALDTDHEDNCDNETHYSSHNYNKVCVTAQVHRADSLFSPVDEGLQSTLQPLDEDKAGEAGNPSNEVGQDTNMISNNPGKAQEMEKVELEEFSADGDIVHEKGPDYDIMNCIAPTGSLARELLMASKDGNNPTSCRNDLGTSLNGEADMPKDRCDKSPEVESHSILKESTERDSKENSVDTGIGDEKVEDQSINQSANGANERNVVNDFCKNKSDDEISRHSTNLEEEEDFEEAIGDGLYEWN